MDQGHPVGFAPGYRPTDQLNKMTVPEEIAQFRKWSWDAAKQFVTPQSRQNYSKAMVGFGLARGTLNIFRPHCGVTHVGRFPPKCRIFG